MNETEKNVFHFVVCAAIFIVGYTLGQKKAAQDRPAAPLDAMSWFSQYGGMNT